jgi:hypothetical protein
LAGLTFFWWAAAVCWAGAEGPIFFDRFDSGPVDPSRWRVVLPFNNPPPTTVRITNGTLELFRRGIVEAHPSLPSSMDLEGRFRFIGDGDTLSIVFRSDLTVTNQSERRGVQAALQQTTGRVFLIPEPFATTPIAGAFTIGKETNVNFRITDNGTTVRLFVQDFFQPVITAVITNRRGSNLAVYNLNGTTSRTQVDEIAVYALQTSVFLDDVLVRTGSVRRSTPTRVRLQSIFTNSAIYYTLDGSLPSFVSTEYTSAFSLSNSATIRAVAYTADFLTTSLSPPIEFQYLPLVRLTNQTQGGGAITFEPAGPYFSNQVVNLTALAAPGWQFLRWEGAVTGQSISNQLVMTNHLALRAVFGTTATITLLGTGEVTSVPTGPQFEYGTTLRLLARPATGQFFLRWANAVTGNVSPATLLVTNATPSISALFAPLGASQRSLTVLLDGSGTVGIAPAANVFTNGQSVTLTPQPDGGQIFLGWAGAYQGYTNPLTLRMTESKTLTAKFGPAVRFEPSSLSFGTNGFQSLLTGGPELLGPGLVVQQSTNLSDWTPVMPWTNRAPWWLQHAAATNHPHLFYRVIGP